MVGSHRERKPLAECNGWREAEDRSRSIEGRKRITNVASACRLVDGIDASGSESLDLLPKLIERRLRASTDVEDLARDRRGRNACTQVRVDDVGDVGEITRLLAVAVDRGTLLAQGSRD